MLLGSIFLLDWDDPVVVCGIFDIVFVTSAVIFFGRRPYVVVGFTCVFPSFGLMTIIFHWIG